MLRENGERREQRVPQRNNASERNHVETGDSPVPTQPTTTLASPSSAADCRTAAQRP
jgi:hypothetical protein